MPCSSRFIPRGVIRRGIAIARWPYDSTRRAGRSARPAGWRRLQTLSHLCDTGEARSRVRVAHPISLEPNGQKIRSVIDFVRCRIGGCVCPGASELDYDFLAPEAERRPMIESEIQKAQDRAALEPNPALLIDEAGRLDQDRLDELMKDRNHRPVYLQE